MVNVFEDMDSNYLLNFYPFPESESSRISYEKFTDALYFDRVC